MIGTTHPPLLVPPLTGHAGNRACTPWSAHACTHACTHAHTRIPHGPWRTEERAGASCGLSRVHAGLPPPSFCSRWSRVCEPSGAHPGLPQEAGSGLSFGLPSAHQLRSSLCEPPGLSACPWWGRGRVQRRAGCARAVQWSGARAQRVRRSRAAGPRHGCLVAPTGGLSSSEPARPLPTWLIQASGEVCEARQASAPSPQRPGAGPPPQSARGGPQAAASAPGTPLPSGPCVLVGRSPARRCPGASLSAGRACTSRCLRAGWGPGGEGKVGGG